MLLRCRFDNILLAARTSGTKPAHLQYDGIVCLLNRLRVRMFCAAVTAAAALYLVFARFMRACALARLYKMRGPRAETQSFILPKHNIVPFLAVSFPLCELPDYQ